MAQGIARLQRDKLISWFGNISVPAQPTNDYWIQWHTGDPGANGDTNISTSLPARTQAGDNAGVRWQLRTGSTDGIMENTVAGETEVVGAGLGGDQISWFSCWEASSGGVHLFNGQVTTPQTVQDDGKLTWQVGDLYCEITGT